VQNKFHAASRTRARLVGTDIRIHGADPILGTGRLVRIGRRRRLPAQKYGRTAGEKASSPRN
jgi:hypothetical protein